jgi:multiple sugar transport system substrate-binding protein
VPPGRPRRRSRLLAGPAVALLTALVVTACTSEAGDPAASPSPTPSTSPTPSASPTGPVTLRFAVYGTPEVVTAYKRLASTYMTEHPEVTVKVEVAEDAVTARDHLERDFDRETPPDLFLTPQTALPDLVDDDRVQPVDVLLEERGVEFGDTYQRLGLEAFAGNAALQCMPNDVSPYVVYYNKRLLLPKALVAPDDTPPTPETGWTWEQFALAARQMSRGDVKGVYLAPRLTTLIPLVRSAGEDVVDDPQEPTTLTLADDGTRAALEQILTVARDPSLTPTPKQLARQDEVSRFENGKLGMMIGTRELVPRLRAKPDLHFDVFPLPSLGRARTLAEVTGYCIAKQSTNVPAAADFMAYAVGEEGSAIMAESGAIVPSNLAALHSASFADPSQFPRNTVVYDQVIRRADAMPRAPGWRDVVSQTQPFLDRMFYAPVIDLDTLLPRIDEVAAVQLERPEESPSATP